MARKFSLDRKLAWQVCRLAGSAPGAASSRHVPGAASLVRFLDAARRWQAPEPMLTAASDAHAALMLMQNRYAEGRAHFDSLLIGSSRPSGAADDLATRRTAFRANSGIWGARVRIQVITIAAAPSQNNEDEVDWLMLTYHGQFQRMRHVEANVLGRHNFFIRDENESFASVGDRVDPIEPETLRLTGGVPAIAAYCSKPLPAMRRHQISETIFQDELLAGGLGKANSVDIVTGVLRRNFGSRWAQSDPDFCLYGARTRTPAEFLVLDVLHSRGLYDEVEPEVSVYSALHDEGPQTYRPHNLLPLTIQPERLGYGVDGWSLPHLPRYTDMLRDCFGRVGWNVDEFELIRVPARYPVIPSILWMKHAIPPRPGG